MDDKYINVNELLNFIETVQNHVTKKQSETCEEIIEYILDQEWKEMPKRLGEINLFEKIIHKGKDSYFIKLSADEIEIVQEAIVIAENEKRIDLIEEIKALLKEG